MTLEASLSVIPAVPPVVVVVLHIVVVGDLVVVLVQHEGLGLVVGEDLQLVLTAHHVIVLVLADNHLKVIMTLKTTIKDRAVVILTFHIPVSSGSGLLILSEQLEVVLLMEIRGSSAQF